MNRVFQRLGFALLAVAALGAAVWAWSRADASLRRLHQRGAIRVGYAVEAPYAFLGADGNVTGESPEVARRVAARLGLGRVEWFQVEFRELIPALEAGRFDVIAAGLFITPERAQRVRFSEPTFRVREALLVARGNPRQLHSYEQVRQHAGVRLAVVAGSVEATMLRQLGLPESQVVAVPDALAGRVAVEAGVTDGLALSSPTVRWMALRDELGRTEVAEPFEQPAAAGPRKLGFGAFAFRKTDHRLHAAWNAALQGFVGSAEHRELIARFGFTEAELPGPARTADILQP